LIEVGNSSLATSVLSLQFEEYPTAFPKFSPNEIVDGKVIKSFSSDRCLLFIKGRKIMARTHIPLHEGEALSLKVTEILPRLILKIMGVQLPQPHSINVSIIFSAIEENLWESLFTNIHRLGLSEEDRVLLARLMNDLSLRSDSTLSPDLLKSLIDKSGLGWEAKLRKIITQKTFRENHFNKIVGEDLKGLLSKTMALKEPGDTLLNRVVATIKNIQLLNHIGLEQQRKIFLPIPFQFLNGCCVAGQILIHLPPKEGKNQVKKSIDQTVFRITFLLELSELGPLRADLAIRGEEIGVKFLLTREVSKLLMEKNLPFFINRLNAKGFSISHMECHLKDPDVVKQPLIKEMIPEEYHSIQLVV